MTDDKRTITESEVPNFAAEFGVSEGLARLGLHSLGWLIVPDPVPPLPTEGLWLLRSKVDDDQVWFAKAITPTLWAKYWPQFERLETQAEGDARWDAVLRDAGFHNARAIGLRLIREAREAEWTDPNPWFRYSDSEMPGAPSFERYPHQTPHTEYRPRTRAQFDAEEAGRG